jgi:acetyltransferase-like isoleucine patch superfamily enzyme
MLLCSMAKCIIRDHVVFGPNVTVITGNHRTDIVGKYISDITEDDKWIMVNGQRENPYDKDVIFEGDNWIGANVTILKGVRIGFGAIVAAGAVVTKDCEPYCVYGGIPAGCISKRFNEEQIQKHEELLGIKDIK